MPRVPTRETSLPRNWVDNFQAYKALARCCRIAPPARRRCPWKQSQIIPERGHSAGGWLRAGTLSDSRSMPFLPSAISAGECDHRHHGRWKNGRLCKRTVRRGSLSAGCDRVCWEEHLTPRRNALRAATEQKRFRRGSRSFSIAISRQLERRHGRASSRRSETVTRFHSTISDTERSEPRRRMGI
jgi:hypothetical protein